MSRYLQSKIQYKQKFKIAPVLVYSSVGVAFIAVVSFFILLNTKFGITASAGASAKEQPTLSSNYIIDFTGKPDEVYLTDESMRLEKCCNASDPENCISFKVILDKNAEGLKFDIASGEVPSGSMYYYIDCENPVAMGESICLSGTHTISFCKPGNSRNSYRITSYSKAQFPEDTSVRIGGPAITLNTQGLLSSSVNWKSTSPGTEGQFNNCLSNTNGSLISFLSNSNCPASIAFAISGIHLSACGITESVFDTIRINIFPEITIAFNPESAIIPAGGSLNLKATVSGGKGKLNYQWFNQKNKSVGYGSSLTISTEGQYTLIVKDEMSETMSCATKSISIKQSSCYRPEQIAVSNISSNSIKINWKEDKQVYGYKLRKRIAGQSKWSGSGTILPYNSRTINSLIENTPYEIQVQTVCSASQIDTSEWSQIVSFKTKSHCSSPDSFIVLSVSDTMVYLKWNAAENAVNYKLRYRKVGESNWTTKNQSASFPTERKIKGLQPNAKYELQVLTECYWKSGTEFSNAVVFTTLSKSDFSVEQTLEIKEREIGKIQINPNPSSGSFTIELTTEANKEFHLSVVNLLGATVHEEILLKSNGSISKSISLPNSVPTGVYLVSIFNEENNYSKTLLLNK